MSGVYIKGMEMPTSPVLFCIHPDGKIFADLEGRWREYKAVPVPPHGKLGDLDELYAHLNEWYLQNRSGLYPTEAMYIRAMLAGIADAPTIIPADTVLENEIHIIDTKGTSNYDPKRRFVISSPTIIPACEEVYDKYTDTAGNLHWTGTQSGKHIVKAKEGE